MSRVDQAGPEPRGPGDGPSWPARPGPRIGVALVVALVVTVVVAGLFAFVALRNSTQSNSGPLRASGIPANVSTHTANMMSLSPLPSNQAPRFTLTDQKGRSLSLSSFKGRAIVLEFMDSHCTDICPIVSQELVDAYRDLGARASRVTFLAVNVNRYHTSVAAVRAFSNGHSLNTIPSWHFFTGSPDVLKAVWASYGITVIAPSPKVDVVHSSFIFFIDAQGRERYLANATDLHTASGQAYLPAGSLSAWGRGISTVVATLLK